MTNLHNLAGLFCCKRRRLRRPATMQPAKRVRRDSVNVRPLLAPAFECLRGKNGVIFDASTGDFDFVASVARVAEYAPSNPIITRCPP